MGCGEWHRSLEWETEVGVRVGVRNRLGEAIGKPVANLHGRVGQSRWRDHREKAKKAELRFPVKRPDFSCLADL